MEVRFKTWKPDTCNCVIEQTHDPQNPAHGVQFSKVIEKCIAHQNVPDDQLNGVIYANSDSDQKRKNLLMKELLGNTALKLSETVTIDGNTIQRFKTGIDYNWSFQGLDKDRVLNISLTGITLSPTIKAIIQSYCDTTFGVGKINIV